jgi:cytoskeleton protein RodZ
VESFGERLKKERDQRKITLEDVALSTKIGTRFLQALEEERFDQLPGGIFNKGFVRAYARHLGIDEQQAITDYLAASGTGQPDPKAEEAMLQELRSKETSEPADRIPWGTLALALLAIALGFAVWGFYSRERSAQPTARVEPPIKVKTTATAPNPEPKTESATPAIEAKVPPAAENAASVPPSSAASETPAKGVELASASAPVEPTRQPGLFLVVIKAHEDAWVSITADGKSIMEDTLVAAGEKAVQARGQVVVKTGNAGALDFSFNGKKLPLQGGYGDVKTLTFDSDGLETISGHAQPVPKN